MDPIYQAPALKDALSGQAAVIRALLAFLPSLPLRRQAERVARQWVARSASG